MTTQNRQKLNAKNKKTKNPRKLALEDYGMRVNVYKLSRNVGFLLTQVGVHGYTLRVHKNHCRIPLLTHYENDLFILSRYSKKSDVDKYKYNNNCGKLMDDFIYINVSYRLFCYLIFTRYHHNMNYYKCHVSCIKYLVWLPGKCVLNLYHS